MLYALNDSEPKAIILDEERLATFNEIRQQLPTMQVVGVRLSAEQETLRHGKVLLPIRRQLRQWLSIQTATPAFFTPRVLQVTPRAHSSPTEAV